MNERIKELINQCTSYSDGSTWTSREEFDKEKFAELIIRECIKAAGDPGDGLIKDNTWHDGVRASIWSIQQEFGLDRNFGVEE